PAEVLAAPADEIALGLVVLNLQARLEPLDLAAALVQVFLVSVDHARHDHFAAFEYLRHSSRQLLGLAGVAAQEIRLAVTVVPPLAAGVGLVPPGADARFAGAAVVEEHRELARLGPVDRRFPL